MTGRFLPPGEGPRSSGPFADLGNWNQAPRPDDSHLLTSRLAVLRRYWILIALTSAAGLLLAVGHIKRQVPVYRAVATVKTSDVRGSLTAGIASEVRPGAVSDPLTSEIQILQSRRTLGMVVDELGLRLSVPTPEFRSAAISSLSIDSLSPTRTLALRFTADSVITVDGSRRVATAYGQQAELNGVRFSIDSHPAVPAASFVITARQPAIDGLRGGLRIVPRPKTSLLDIAFTAPDPKYAQRVANGVAAVYQKQSAFSAQQQSRNRRMFLELQLRQTDSTLAVAQSRLSNFRRDQEVYSARDRFSAEQGGLFGLDVRLQELETDRRMYRSLLSSVQTAGSQSDLRAIVSAPGVAGNPVVGPLYAQLIDYQRARDTLTAGAFGRSRNNPDVQRVDTLIATTRQRIVGAVGSHVEALTARIDALQGLRNTSATAIRDLPAIEAEEVWLTQEAETMRGLANRLRDEHQRARIAEAVELGSVELVDAAMPGSRVPVGGNRIILLGLLGGLAGGAGAAFGLERLNTSIRRRDEIENLLGVPGLAVIPQFVAAGSLGHRGLRALPLPLSIQKRASKREELVTVGDLPSSASEAYRTLRTNIIFSQVAQTIRRLVITSPGPGEGKTTTAANLAVAFAQQGMRVLLIDCDLRRSRLHRVFDLPRSPGLPEMLVGLATVDDVVRQTRVPTLSVILGGTSPPHPAELLGGTQMKAALDKLAQSYDLIILDTPPVLSSADASVLSAAADGVILVLRAGMTDRGAAVEAVQQVTGVGGRVVGCVLNDTDNAMTKYGKSYHYYGYHSPRDQPHA